MPARTSASAASVASTLRIGSRSCQPLAVDPEPCDEDGQCTQPEPDIAAHREHWPLVLLQIAVVCERQPFHRGEQAREPADCRARLAARELRHVRIELLGHHRRAGRRRLGQPHEVELTARPQHDLLADTREMDVEDGCRVEVVERKVAIRDRVDRVAHLAGRRRQPERRARERTSAERARRGSLGGTGKARAITCEHLDPGQKMMPKGDRLPSLQMRVPGHHGVCLRLGEREHDEAERVDLGARLGARVEHVKAERRSYLVVSGAPGVDLAADLAELPLDRAVHVLVLFEVGRGILRDPGETCLDLAELVVRQEPGRVEALGVQSARLTVVGEQLEIVGVEELPYGVIDRALDPARPHRHAVDSRRSDAVTGRRR